MKKNRGIWKVTGKGFEKKPSTLHLGCFIAKSTSSDAHAVYLGIGRGSKPQKGEPKIERRLMSPHASITDAWKILGNCQKILSNFSCDINASNDAITQKFVRQLLDTYGDYPDDEGIIKLVSGHKEAFAWIQNGGTLMDADLPSGIVVQIDKPIVIKTCKVWLMSLGVPVPENSYGNYDDNHVYTIGQTLEKPVCRVADEMYVFSSYVTAAYVADYLNRLNKDSLTAEEVKQLLFESNRIQGKI